MVEIDLLEHGHQLLTVADVAEGLTNDCNENVQEHSCCQERRNDKQNIDQVICLVISELVCLKVTSSDA